MEDRVIMMGASVGTIQRLINAMEDSILLKGFSTKHDADLLYTLKTIVAVVAAEAEINK